MSTRDSLSCCALTVLLAFGSLGCSGTTLRIPNVPEHAYDQSRGRPVSAEASGFQLLLWIPIGVNGRHQDCYRALQQQAPGHYLTDVMVQDSWTYAFVGTVYTVRMKAMAYPYVSP
jgi:hypothetical protein